MKCVILRQGVAHVRAMSARRAVYLNGFDGWLPGYVLDDDCSDIHWMVNDAVACGMYEGNESSGFIDDDGQGFSWAVVPETVDEASHLAKHCPKSGYDETGC